MRSNVRKSRAAFERNDRPKFVELNSEFHMMLAACSRNPVFEEILSMLDKRIRRVLWVVQPQVVEASIDEHEAIVDAIEKGDARRQLTWLVVTRAGTRWSKNPPRRRRPRVGAPRSRRGRASPEAVLE